MEIRPIPWSSDKVNLMAFNYKIPCCFCAVGILLAGVTIPADASAQADISLESYMAAESVEEDLSGSVQLEDALQIPGAEAETPPAEVTEPTTAEEIPAEQTAGETSKTKQQVDSSEVIESTESEIVPETQTNLEEPPQENLTTEQVNQEQTTFEEEVYDPDIAQEVPSVQNEDDALPPLNTKIKIETDGFDYVGERNVTTEFDLNDPNRKSQQELAEEIRREAFDAAITGLFPLSPDNIKDLLKEYDKTKRAVEEPVYGVPTPRVNVETISLDPGVPPMSLKTAVGHITTVNILDVTGAPWPIQDISWAGDFEVIEPEEGGHIIRITPMGFSAYGNMSIRLLTLKTPITIMLTTGKDEVQYRVDARIPEYGPFAQAPLIDGGTERVAGNATIMAVLDGTPPSGAERLDVSGVDGRTTAYKIRNLTYVRTPLTLLSPGWEQSVSSADGMNVYALDETPILLLSDKGRFMRASVREGKDLFADE